MSIECMDFKPHESGALKGFANFRINKMGIELFGCSVFMKDGRRWLSLPSREYNDPSTGEKKYISIMRFMEKEHHDGFCKSALQAMDAFYAQNVQPAPVKQPVQQQYKAPVQQTAQDVDLPF